MTTRKRREGEKEGRDYYFVSEETFVHAVNNGMMYNNVVFDGNHYGVSKEEIDSCVQTSPTLLVIEPTSLKVLRERYKGTIINVVINYSEESRASQMLFRGDKIDSVYRRIKNDRTVFNVEYPEGTIFIEGDGKSIADYVDMFFDMVPPAMPPFTMVDGSFMSIPHLEYVKIYRAKKAVK